VTERLVPFHCDWCRVEKKVGACRKMKRPHCRACHETLQHGGIWLYRPVLKKTRASGKKLGGTFRRKPRAPGLDPAKRKQRISLRYEVYECSRCQKRQEVSVWAMTRQTITKCKGCGGACYPVVGGDSRHRSTRFKRNRRRCEVCLKIRGKANWKVCPDCRRRQLFVEKIRPSRGEEKTGGNP
jgi:hypothetical protein